MAKLVLASALARWLSPDGNGAQREVALAVAGSTLAQALDQLFATHPKLRGYVLDEQHVVRHHVAIFIDGQSIRDKANLSQPLAATSEVYVMQALSGG